MSNINRAMLRGKPLDNDCKKANIETYKRGNDDKTYCYGLYCDQNDWDIAIKCRECKAYIENELYAIRKHRTSKGGNI